MWLCAWYFQQTVQEMRLLDLLREVVLQVCVELVHLLREFLETLQGIQGIGGRRQRRTTYTHPKNDRH